MGSDMTLIRQGMESMKLSHFARLGRTMLTAAAVLALAAPVASAGTPSDNAAQKAGNAEDRGGNRAGEPVREPAPEKAPADAVEDEAAAKKPAAAAPCEERVFSRVFKPWNDRALYTLAPGGDFETLAEGWTLEGPAVIAADSSPFLLGATLGTGSLELPAGATAVSPPICVQRGFPTFRFLARSVSVEPSQLKVQVVYASGKTKTTGLVKPAAEWAPTRKLSLAQGRFRTRRRGTALVQLRFAALAGTVHVDDVYVDPRYNR
jgi:hypothetical protein